MIAQYQIEQHSNASFTALVNSFSTTSTSFSVPAPTQGTFFFRVRACNVTGCSGYVNGANSISVAGAPAVPTGLVKTQVSMCTWQATWTAVSGATSYKVIDTKSTIRTTTTTQVSVPWSTTCPPPAGVTPNSNKPESMQACNSAGCSASAFFP